MLNAIRARAGQSGPSLDEPALFLLRPERGEAPFLAAHATKLHGAVLLGRHLAPYAEGSAEQRAGRRGDELAQAARRVGVDHVHDPDTAVLPLLTGDDREDGDRRFGRAALMASAGSVPLGVAPSDLANAGALRDLVVSTLRSQISVTLPAAPYFRFDSDDDPWLAVNLRAAAATQALARAAPIALFVCVGLRALRDGVLERSAGAYARALHARGLAFLQVAGLDVEHPEPGSLDAYLRAVASYRAHGFNVIADRVGRFGVAAVAAGARGMACGTRVYRVLPDARVGHQYSRSGRVRYWAPERGDSLDARDARRRHARGSLPPCPIADCDVLAKESGSEELRWHAVHLVLDELAATRRDAAAFAGGWTASPRNYVRGWGATLLRAIQRSEQA